MRVKARLSRVCMWRRGYAWTGAGKTTRLASTRGSVRPTLGLSAQLEVIKITYFEVFISNVSPRSRPRLPGYAVQTLEKIYSVLCASILRITVFSGKTLGSLE